MAQDKQNWRIESTLTTTTFNTPDGAQVELTYASEECSVYDRTCPTCGQAWEARGITGALLDLITEGNCPSCREDATT